MNIDDYNRVISKYGIENLLSIQFDNVSVYIHNDNIANGLSYDSDCITITEYDLHGHPYLIYKPIKTIKGIIFKPSNYPREKYDAAMLNIRA